MSISLERSRRIVEAMDSVRKAVGTTATVEGLDAAKSILRDLASRRELFPETDFPWPAADQENVMYRIYSTSDDDVALYVDLLNQGAAGAPHDHGNAWAIVVGMEGQERHSLYRRVDGGKGEGPAELSDAGHVDVGPGGAVSMLPGGVHSIAALSEGRVMMMHCYARPFHAQDRRLEYDIAARKCVFGVAATGEIREVLLDARALQA